MSFGCGGSQQRVWGVKAVKPVKQRIDAPFSTAYVCKKEPVKGVNPVKQVLFVATETSHLHRFRTSFPHQKSEKHTLSKQMLKLAKTGL